MGFQVLMVLALVVAFAVPPIFGFSAGAMIASHLAILTVTLAILFGTLNLNKPNGPR